MVGPTSGNEGLAVRDYARSQPDKTFLNGCSATQMIGPQQLTIFNDTCFVADSTNNRALRFSLIQIEKRPRRMLGIDESKGRTTVQFTG